MLAAQVITIAALGKAAWLAFFRRRGEEHGTLEPLRPGMAAHTGSVNDYAAYAVAGMLAVIAVLTLT